MFSMNCLSRDMTMATTIERITSFDELVIKELFTKAGETSIEPSAEFFVHDNNVLLVARTDGEPSGFLFGYVLSGLKTPYPKMLLYSIDVFEQFRRRGIATALIAELKKLAREHRCSEIFVLTETHNEAAMGLYRKTGGVRQNQDDVMFVYDRSVF